MDEGGAERRIKTDVLLAKCFEELILVHGDGRHGENRGSMPQTPRRNSLDRRGRVECDRLP